jgi:hypothetical protein
MHHGPVPDRFPCPCCGYRTLSEQGGYEICPVCFWEDDGAAPSEVSGPNRISLAEAQHRFLSTGAVHPEDRSRTRAPRPDEARGEEWHPWGQEDPVDRHVDDVIAEYNAARAALAEMAPTLSYPEVRERFRALSTEHGLAFPEPELELLAHLMHDRHWRRRHPVEAVGWVLRHRRSASLRTRLRQLWTGSVRFAG